MQTFVKQLKGSFIRFGRTYWKDIIVLSGVLLVILLYGAALFRPGMVVFSDMSFGLSSNRYLEEIFGAWNNRWSTTTLLNVPRLLYIFPFYLLSLAFGASGPILIKSFIFGLLIVSAVSMFALTKRLHSVYVSAHFSLLSLVAFGIAALFYALNPWIITRIQHIYLLCGYSVFPLALLLFLNIFDPKFREQLNPNFTLSARLTRRTWIDLVGLAVIFAFMAGGIHYFFFSLIYMGIMVGLIFLKTFWIHRKEHIIKPLIGFYVRSTVAFGLIFLLFNSYWFFMYVGSILTGSQASQHNINVSDTLMLFSRNSSWSNVVYLTSYWWPMFDLTTLPLSFWLGGGLILLLILLGALVSYRQPIHLFFTGLSLPLIIFATGTHEQVADFFVLFVTKTPLIGAMFRDPNKLVGLLMVSYSLLLASSLATIFNRPSKTLPLPLYRTLTIGITVVALSMFFLPYRSVYMEGFYRPVTMPKEYTTVQSLIDGKWLQFPVADEMTQPGTGVATPTWNKNPNPDGEVKATGDVQVYGSQADTVFHHEGSTPTIGYMMTFLQYLLDTGRSDQAGQIAKAFGLNQFAYRTEYAGMAERQAFNKQLLKTQHDLLATKHVGLFTLFDLIEPLDTRTVPQLILTPYGLERSVTFSTLDDYSLGAQSILYATQAHQDGLSWLKQDDIIEMAEENDLLLSQVPDAYFWKPFDAIDSANSFLNWGKTFLANSDWRWYLRTQGITNPSFDLDFGDGIGLSFASAKIDAPVYKLDQLKTKQVASFNSMLEDETFFKADNPDVVDLSPNPLSKENNLPVLRAEVAEGDPKYIWQVAKSGKLKALPNNAYRFDITASGRGVDRLHVKVRFYDAKDRELNQTYVVAPRDSGDVDAIHLQGEYVTPKDAKTMRIDLLSFQRPERKTYWWVHDIKIYSFEDYMVPNTIEMTKDTVRGRYAGYARVLLNKNGGQLDFEFNGQKIPIHTKQAAGAKLVWVPLGNLVAKGATSTLRVTNTLGFNAIQNIVLIPKPELTKLTEQLDEKLAITKTMMVLEAETAFDYTGHVQSERNYPGFSFGKGIAAQRGTLQRSIDIREDGNYEIQLKATRPTNPKGRLTVLIRNETDVVYRRVLIASDFKATDIRKTDLGKNTITFDPLHRDFAYQLESLPDVYRALHQITLEDIPLVSGRYEIELTYSSAVPSLVTMDDLHKFDPNEIVTDKPLAEPEAAANCATCVSITEDMFRDSERDGVYTIDYDPTCSCDWYIYASQKVKAKPNHEYLLQFDAVSQNVRQRHLKVYYLDADDRVIGTDFINEVEEDKKSRWNHYEQILIPPKKAVRMQLHIWTRGNEKTAGKLKLKNLEFLPYEKLILVDQFMVAEQTGTPLFATAAPETLSVDKSWMSRQLTSKDTLGRFTVNDSPTPLFELKDGVAPMRGNIALNGVSQLYRSPQKEAAVTVVLRPIYYGGLGLLILAFPLSFLIIWWMTGRRPETWRTRLRHRFSFRPSFRNPFKKER
ncbi:hypothetical protein [Exiguobacterium oxidotolerans]|uniref:Uncharacterized protein n=1 Tax=Exiguobacterium oxidotolerans TaxID=223958 RepID=A0A653IGV6_9BACL|nr:hypothetical protein [Exiguobacterium oxidotolerans]VWX38378.1 conserved membrane hypothetical protein [Exiguobacterium oxidotolerans]